MFKQTLLLSLLVSSTLSYSISSDCIGCLEVKSSNKYCMTSPDSTSGFCCDKSDGTDVCSNSQYMCTDRALTTSMKYAYCPFQPQYCTGSSQDTLYDSSLHTEATTIFFGRDKVCTWRIKVASNYSFMKRLKVTIDNLQKANCFLTYGSSMLNATNEQQCQNGTEVLIDADQHVFVIAQGSGSGAYMQFSYKLEDKLDIKIISIIYSCSAFGLILLAGVIIILIARYCVISAIKTNQEQWHKMAIDMSKIVNQSGNQRMPNDMTPGDMIPPSRAQVAPSSRMPNQMNMMRNQMGMGMMNNMVMGNNMPMRGNMNQMNQMNMMDDMDMINDNMGNQMMGNNMMGNNRMRGMY